MYFSTNLSFQQPISNPIKDSLASHREDLDSRIFEIDHELRRFNNAENNILGFKVYPNKVTVHKVVKIGILRMIMGGMWDCES